MRAAFAGLAARSAAPPVACVVLLIVSVVSLIDFVGLHAASVPCRVLVVGLLTGRAAVLAQFVGSVVYVVAVLIDNVAVLIYVVAVLVDDAAVLIDVVAAVHAFVQAPILFARCWTPSRRRGSSSRRVQSRWWRWTTPWGR